MTSVKVSEKNATAIVGDCCQLAEGSMKDSSNSQTDDVANRSKLSVLEHICSLIETMETELNCLYDQTFGRRRGAAKAVSINILLNELKGASYKLKRAIQGEHISVDLTERSHDAPDNNSASRSFSSAQPKFRFSAKKPASRSRQRYAILDRTKQEANEPKFKKETALVQEAIGPSKDVVRWRKEKRVKAPVVCSLCHKSLNCDFYNFAYHVLTIHGGEKMECPVCGKKFTRVTYLRAHRAAKHGDSGFQCQICGRKYIAKWVLKRHFARVHAGFKHECQACGKQFSTVCVLRKHVQTIHKGEGRSHNEFSKGPNREQSCDTSSSRATNSASKEYGLDITCVEEDKSESARDATTTKMTSNACGFELDAREIPNHACRHRSDARNPTESKVTFSNENRLRNHVTRDKAVDTDQRNEYDQGKLAELSDSMPDTIFTFSQSALGDSFLLRSNTIPTMNSHSLNGATDSSITAPSSSPDFASSALSKVQASEVSLSNLPYRLAIKPRPDTLPDTSHVLDSSESPSCRDGGSTEPNLMGVRLTDILNDLEPTKRMGKWRKGKRSSKATSLSSLSKSGILL